MDPIDDFAQPTARRPALAAKLFCLGVWIFSGTLLAFSAVCYAGRFDACAVVTLFPPWCWAAIGLLLAWLGVSRPRYLPSILLTVAWLAFLVLASDSPESFVRALLPGPERGANLRVVSLNCAGNSAAARSVAALDPDVVLIQESPWADTLTALAAEMYGSSANLVRGVDASIFARGNVTAVDVPPEFRANFVHARIKQDGQTIHAISLRLYPCPIRLDLWSRDCWRYYAWNRETRRRQLSKIANYAKSLPADEPLILGGDFNCPPRDAVLELLEPRLTDAFSVAGRGWGATIIEFCGWPLIRIDQIWTSPQLHATNAYARRADSSDHHMAVADFSLGGRQD